MNSKEVIEANLRATSPADWSTVKSLSLEYIEETKIDGKTVAKTTNIKEIQLPDHQRTKSKNGQNENILTLTKNGASATYKYRGEQLLGVTGIPLETVSVKEELDILHDLTNLVFKDTLLNDIPYYLVKDTLNKIHHFYQSNTWRRTTKIESTGYGTSTTTYQDFREVLGYSFPHKVLIDVPEAKYQRIIRYTKISVNPEFATNRFDPDPSTLALKKGEQVPLFYVESLDSATDTYNNENIKGEVVLIDFWATWCKPCLREFPHFERMYQNYHDRGFDILSISLDEDRKRLDQFISNRKLPWKMAVGANGFDSRSALLFQVASLPRTLLIDGQGVIIATDLDATGNNLEQLLEQHLGN